MQERIKSRSNASSVSQRIRGWFLDVNMEARQQLAIPGIQPLRQFCVPGLGSLLMIGQHARSHGQQLGQRGLYRQYGRVVGSGWLMAVIVEQQLQLV